MKVITVIFFFLFSFVSVWANEINIEIIGKFSSRNISVDSEIEELALTKRDTVVPGLLTIKGLHHLKNLKKLDIGFANFSEVDKLFWKDLSRLEVLRLHDVIIVDFDFLKMLHGLKKFYIYDDIIIMNTDMDLSGNKNLEYIQMDRSTLEHVPYIFNVSENFKFCDIAWCMISDLNSQRVDPNVTYIMHGEDLDSLDSSIQNVIRYEDIEDTAEYIALQWQKL